MKETTSTTSGNILIVDDISDSLQLLMKALIDQGYNVSSVESGQEALNLVQTQFPDLILLNVILPDINGYEVFSKLKLYNFTRDIPVLFISGLNASDIIHVFEVGGVDYVSKPFQPTEVLARVNTHIEMHRMRLNALQQSADLKLANENLLIEIEKDYTGEESLKIQNRLLHALINSQKEVIIFSLDKNYCYTAFNERHRAEMKTIWNVDIEIGLNLLNCIATQELRDIAKQSIDKALHGETFSEIQHQPGVEIYYEFNWSPVHHNEKIIGVIAFIRDITERKKAEDNLKYSEEKFRNIFEHSTVGKSMTTIDGKVITNKTFCDMLGYSQEEIANLKWQSLTYPDDIKNDEKIVNLILSGERKSVRWEKRYIHKNGSIVWVDISTKLQHDNDGKPLYFITSIIDITKRKRDEEENSQLLTIIENSLNEIYVFDSETLRFKYINNGALSNIGFTLKEMSALTPLNIKPEFTEESFQDLIRPLLKKEKDRQIFQTVHRRKDGSFYAVEVYLQLMAIGAEKLFLSVINDITERKQNEFLLLEKQHEVETQNEEYQQINEELVQTNEELLLAKKHAEESDRLKTAFLQNMSHEIRTPMNAIMGFAALLPEHFKDQEKLEHYSEIINQRCNDLLDIINEILDISKIESGQLPVSLEDCNLDLLLTELSLFFTEYQKRFDKHHIELIIQAHCDPSGSIIVTDKVKLKQILINLISNAFKFTEKGKIQAGCKLDENRHLIFYVSDTGIGIPPEKQNFIFERFSQLEPKNDKILTGTGLGLSIVKGLIDLLGGKIWLESELDIGTTFYFMFPYMVADKVNEPLLTDFSATPVFSGQTVLLVEDDVFNTLYLKEILSGIGLNIIHTQYGCEAVQLALNKTIDLILMDIRLPDIDGYEATRQIKQQKPDLVIIAQTAYAAHDDKRKAIDAGCDDYISKPVRRELLFAMMLAHLNKNKINVRNKA